MTMTSTMTAVVDRSMFHGHVEANLMHFARVLRAAGLPIGTGQILDAVRAVGLVGVTSRDGVYWALASCFVRRREELPLFDEAFDLFFRDTSASSHALASLVSLSKIPASATKTKSGSRRVHDATAPKRQDSNINNSPENKLDYDVTMTASSAEAIRTRDFEKMTADEVKAARDAIKRMTLPDDLTVKTRRLAPEVHGSRIDIRRTLKATLREGGDSIPLKFRGRRQKPPPIVAICDVSGSMERYSRMVLHFLHTLTRDRTNVSSFVFGTRLTNITRWLRERDVDEALASVGQNVTDWAGGTRIGESLHLFNKIWSRRVLGQNAIVILITDGLERGDVGLLGHEIERLHKSCRRLIWLNPLLRYEGFEPRAAGIKTMLEHVDDFRTVHHLQSLEDLVRSLGRRTTRMAA